jgi:hypothetical protein
MLFSDVTARSRCRGMLCWHADMPTKTTALPSGLLTQKKHGEICKNQNTGKTRIKKSMTLKIINQKVESISCLFNQPGTFFSVCLMSLGFFQPIVKSKSKLDLFNQPPLTPSFLSVRCHWVFTHSL